MWPQVHSLTRRYPKLSFRKVGCNLGDPKGSYLQIIKDATADIPVQVVFSNAGYIIIAVRPLHNLNLLTLFLVVSQD